MWELMATHEDEIRSRTGENDPKVRCEVWNKTTGMRYYGVM